MYAALDEEGTLIYAKEAIENRNYYCCHCDQLVQLILTDTRKYFRHTNKTANNINERLIHRKGKQLIIEELQKYNFESLESEYYLPEIKQRPDILINQKLIVEYQCAKIDENILSDRVDGYRKVGLRSIWILGEAYLDVQLRREHLKFIDYSENFGYYILMLDSLNQRFTLFHHVKFLGPFNKIFFQREIFEKGGLPDLFSYQPEEYPIKSQVMSAYLLKKLRKKNDPQAQWVKMNFYQQRNQTVESYLNKHVFTPQPPIYQLPIWQIVCGKKPRLLQQPLLDYAQIKKPPQL